MIQQNKSWVGCFDTSLRFAASLCKPNFINWYLNASGISQMNKKISKETYDPGTQKTNQLLHRPQIIELTQRWHLLEHPVQVALEGQIP
ncbi:hypothetical protein EUGRSUZ_F03202 [Eucalyptus grandis]|uniref:Uncharacterized protein n=2 Tax=Eucalyptus grandis TaxID=71139 RepID=A0ACC3KMX5_EUCGR|nr:hypothetical protein EUGRSUZ_F03202 [Eucalyptus grandis]